MLEYGSYLDHGLLASSAHEDRSAFGKKTQSRGAAYAFTATCNNDNLAFEFESHTLSYTGRNFAIFTPGSCSVKTASTRMSI